MSPAASSSAARGKAGNLVGLLTGPNQGEAGTAQLAAPQERLAAMPIKDTTDNGEAQPVATRAACTTVVQTREWRKDPLPIFLRNTLTIILHIQIGRAHV